MKKFLQYMVDEQQRTVRFQGKPLRVTAKIFDLLAYFINNAGIVLDKDSLIDAVWRGRVTEDVSWALNRFALGNRDWVATDPPVS